jgi:hypothetical protein
VDVYAANDAKPCQKEHGCNVARQRKRAIGCVGFMEAESSGWKTALLSTFGRLKSYNPLYKYR